MFNKKAALLLICVFPFSASAEWVGGMDYKRFTIKDTGPDLQFNSVALTGGYRFDVTKEFSLTPQFTYGLGLNDDTFDAGNGVTAQFELDRFYELSLRGQYQLTDKLYGFAEVSRHRIVTSFNDTNSTVKTSRSNWGAAIGIGYQYSDRTSFELAYQTISSTDVISLGVRYKF